MRNVTPDTITDAFLGYCADSTAPRLRTVLELFVRHLHAFAREAHLTHAEWNAAIDFLYRAGKISTPERNEFILTSDVLGLSSLVDMINTPAGATASSVLGPFHIADMPVLPWGADLIRDNAGDPVVVAGTVSDDAGRPLAGAQLDVWQTAANGLYSNQDPAQARDNLRFRMRCDEAGRFAFSSVRPAPYTVPSDGPVGDLLRATGRHPWRPSHFHFIVTAAGCRPLVTELFPADDRYLDEDAVFGVREDLVMAFSQQTDRASAPAGLEIRDRLPVPYARVDLEIRLARA